jgi:hypothetical protein
MRDTILDKFVVITANLPTVSKVESNSRMDLLETVLSKSVFKDRYKLIEVSDFLIDETAFMVVVYNFDEVRELIDVAKDYNQDSVLYVDSNRNCFLLGTDGANLPMGTLKAATKSQALEYNSYIFDSSTNQYYLVTGEFGS